MTARLLFIFQVLKKNKKHNNTEKPQQSCNLLWAPGDSGQENLPFNRKKPTEINNNELQSGNIPHGTFDLEQSIQTRFCLCKYIFFLLSENLWMKISQYRHTMNQ